MLSIIVALLLLYLAWNIFATGYLFGFSGFDERHPILGVATTALALLFVYLAFVVYSYEHRFPEQNIRKAVEAAGCTPTHVLSSDRITNGFTGTVNLENGTGQQTVQQIIVSDGEVITPETLRFCS